jgi:hypothetical protein
MPFTLTIDTTKKAFGETEHQARTKICYLLEQIKGIIGSGRDPQPLLSADGEVVGEYTLDLESKQPRVPRQATDQGAIDKINATATADSAKVRADAQKKRDALSA